MAMSTAEKKQVIEKFQRDPSDTGSPEVQVAVLTASITRLTEHMKANKHDFHSRRGLLKQVSRRRKLLDYLKKVNLTRYQKLLEELGLRK